MMNESASEQPLAFVGIDWADQKHDVVLRSVGDPAEAEHQVIQSEINALNDWIAQMHERFGAKGKVLVCLEQSRGAYLPRRLGWEARKHRSRLCGMGFPIDCLNLLTKAQRKCEVMIFPASILLRILREAQVGGKNFANTKGRFMKGYILRDKEAQEEVKKARKAKNQGKWIRGSWERQANGGLQWIRPKFICRPAALGRTLWYGNRRSSGRSFETQSPI
jgi:hypothetical protein